jgi:hypothetical protein
MAGPRYSMLLNRPMKSRLVNPNSRSTTKKLTQSDPSGAGADRWKSASCDQTGRITLSFLIHLSSRLFFRLSSQFVLRFYEGANFSRRKLPSGSKREWNVCLLNTATRSKPSMLSLHASVLSHTPMSFSATT